MNIVVNTLGVTMGQSASEYIPWVRTKTYKVRSSVASPGADDNKDDHSPLQHLCYVHAAVKLSGKHRRTSQGVLNEEIKRETLRLRKHWRSVIHAWASKLFTPEENDAELLVWTRALNRMCHKPLRTKGNDALALLDTTNNGILSGATLDVIRLVCMWERHTHLLRGRPLKNECFWIRHPSTQRMELQAELCEDDEVETFEFTGVGPADLDKTWNDVYFAYLDYMINYELVGNVAAQEELMRTRHELFNCIHEEELEQERREFNQRDKASDLPPCEGVQEDGFLEVAQAEQDGDPYY